MDKPNLQRRMLLGQGAMGLGAAALASLLPGTANSIGNTSPPERGRGAFAGLPGLPHVPPTAKRAIYLFMAGGPSQLDLFDWKPNLAKLFGQDLPASVRGNQRLTTMTSGQAHFPLAPTIYNFKQHGQSGAWVSDLLPHFAKVVDDVTFVKSVHTDAINHDPAITLLQTGNMNAGKPSLGAWLSYGLGSDNQDLPAYVVMTSKFSAKAGAQALFSRLWGAGFLPSRHQGVGLRSSGDPVLYLSNPAGVDRKCRQQMIQTVVALNKKRMALVGDPEIETRVAQYEMAFRMQVSVPELADVTKEPASTFKLYGDEARTPGTFAYNCLMARRLAERGVRLSQIFHRGWDQHGDLTRDHPLQCRDVDQAMAALVTDLKHRGMLEDTLVVWGGEFGRTAYSQGRLTAHNFGRDHHPRCFTMWMAGGGFKPGLSYGQTDDFSYNITENPVHIRDLNATLLRTLGIDHERLTFKYAGLDQKLTGVESAKVVTALLGTA